MNETTLMIVGSLIVIVFVISLSYIYLGNKTPSSPESYPVEVKAVQKYMCTSTNTVDEGDYSLILPSTYTLYLDFYAKNYGDKPVTIDKIQPLPINQYQPYTINARISGYETFLKTYTSPWGSATNIQTTFNPGDTLEIQGVDVKRTSGTILSTSNVKKQSDVPSDYECPFTGNEKYDLNVNGNEISSDIGNPGCAPIVVSQLPYQTNNYLILTKAKIGQYKDQYYDIPYYVELYGGNNKRVGMYRRPVEIGMFNSTKHDEKNDTSNQYEYLALNVDNKVGYLYLNDNKNYILSEQNAPTQGYLVIGEAREKQVVTGGVLTIFSNVYLVLPETWVNFYIDSLTYEIKYYGTTVISGSLHQVKYGDSIDDDLERYGAVYADLTFLDNSWYFHYFTLYDFGGSRVTMYVQPFSNVKKDYLFIWDDEYATGSDGTGDDWVRVTVFNNGTIRIGMWLGLSSYSSQVMAIGNSAFFLKLWFENLENSRRGIYYEITSNGVPHLYDPNNDNQTSSAPLSAYIDYLGLFKSSKVTIKGLFSGDKVIIKSKSSSVTLTASGDTLVVDLLNYFTAEDIINTVQSGGFKLTVIPSTQHLVYLFPMKALVHVIGEEHDMWIPIQMPLKTVCDLGVDVHSVHGKYTATLTTKDGKIWKIMFNGKLVGYYPSGSITLYQGVAKFKTKDNKTYTFNGPLVISFSAPWYVGVLKGVNMYAIPFATEINVTGIEYHLTYSMGK